MEEVVSSNIAAIRYYEDSKELHVRFSSGLEVYQGFLEAESIDKYLNARIKGGV